MWGWTLRVATALALFLPLNLQAGDYSPEEWLERMADSMHRHSYEGTFVFQRGERIDTVRVVHAAEEDGYRERLQTLTGSAREVIREVDRISAIKGARVEGGGRQQGGAPQRPPAFAAAMLRANERYDLSSSGFDRIAGFPCYQLHAEARDAYRYSHQYCLHRDTGLPLLSELIDGDGQLLERLVFTELEFLDVVFEESLAPDGCDARRIEVRAAGASPEEQDRYGQWYFEGLPPGFSAVIVTERSIGPEEDGGSSLHFVLSDGLATVSVYVDPTTDDAETFEGVTRSGATHALARPLAGHQVTVVGEVPVKTVERIADAARFRAGGTD
ncbi:MAG: MucB/RseB C-terminal domain-containing protein [Thioalkalivibrio sp.]|nr:MucB/RseB C-terminal domain-containing protein [Thioalkalivibrio sp.]